MNLMLVCACVFDESPLTSKNCVLSILKRCLGIIECDIKALLKSFKLLVRYSSHDLNQILNISQHWGRFNNVEVDSINTLQVRVL